VHQSCIKKKPLRRFFFVVISGFIYNKEILPVDYNQ